MAYNPVNERLMYARFKGYPRNVTVMVVYAPTTTSNDECIEKLYDEIDNAIKLLPKEDIKIVVGD